MRALRITPRLFLPVAFATIGVTLFEVWTARAASDPHGVDVMPVLGAMVLILLGAKLGGALFAWLKQPAVLGELAVGIAIGNLGLFGYHGFEGLRDQAALQVFAQVGVLFLLFQVGLESDVGKMLAVGASSMVVAVLGVAAPMVLGYFCSLAFFPTHNVLTHWFVGATLCATSVGITARVLSDLKRTASTEGRIILGAAVIDDVLGLIVLAVVSGIIQAADQGRAFAPASAALIVAKAVGFLVGAIVIGQRLSKVVFRFATRLEAEGVLLALSLAFCFGLAYVAGRVGLAPIVGAFAAGLVLDRAHYAALRERSGEHEVEELMRPLAAFLVPVFFVLMGMGVDLAVFGNRAVLGFAAVLTIAAVLGKQLCALGVFEKGADRLAVGLGMIPRGEVGLIFASIGATLHIAGERVVDDAVFSAVVIMVVLTTMMTPPLLVWRLRRIPAPKT